MEYSQTTNHTNMLGTLVRHNGLKYVTHTTLGSAQSALVTFQFWQKVVIFSIIGFIFGSLLINWHVALILMISVLSFIYFADLLFSIRLISKTFVNSPEVSISESELQHAKGRLWPSFTILCPLYKEARVIPQFIEAMSSLDYPKHQLEVLLLLEDDDIETITAVAKMGLPEFVRVEVVPDSLPKTKPKACNYGLAKASGSYVVIFDAEDVPEADQLKKVVLAFEKSDAKTVCIQAKLNFYNQHQNLLTRLFASEYSLWFDLILPGLQAIEAPIPLGGTSNHFRTSTLVGLKAWDPFNVTEDCDLGIRLAKKGYKTAIVNSTTYEEANSNMVNWLRQRSRWIKGYMQTYLVHMRLENTFKHFTLMRFISFQITVGGKILSLFINPLMWAITISYFAFRPTIGPLLQSLYLTPVYYIAVVSLIFGNFMYLYIYMIGVSQRKQYELVKYIFFVPFYWLYMSLAATIGLFELIVRPHYWQKTHHGFHLNQKHKIHSAAVLTHIENAVAKERKRNDQIQRDSWTLGQMETRRLIDGA